MKRRVLIIDDNVDLCRATARILERDGHTVVCMLNGQAAVGYLDRISDEMLPEFILTDFEMPNMNGMEFRRAQLINPRYASIRTLMWTGHDLYALRKEMQELQLTVLPKPADMSELRRIVAQ